MSPKSTISSFNNFYILLYMLGLNRYHLSQYFTHKIITRLFFILMKSVYIITIFCINYNTYKDPDIPITVALFQYCVTIEWLYLILRPSGSKKLCSALDKLDIKCGVDDEHFQQIRRRINVIFYGSLCFLVLDIAVLNVFVEKVNFLMVLVVCLATTAHETELLFYGLLLQCVTSRQPLLARLPAHRGMTAHRYLMLAGEHLNGCFNVEAFVLLTGALITTFIYIVQIFIADSTVMLRLVLFLSWREFKSLYSLWFVCAAAARGEAECRELAFRVACRIVNYSHGHEGCGPAELQLLRRWHRYLVSQRARPIAGDCITLDLGVPLQLLQVSATYLIIFVQIYRAY